MIVIEREDGNMNILLSKQCLRIDGSMVRGDMIVMAAKTIDTKRGDGLYSPTPHGIDDVLGQCCLVLWLVQLAVG